MHAVAVCSASRGMKDVSSRACCMFTQSLQSEDLLLMLTDHETAPHTESHRAELPQSHGCSISHCNNMTSVYVHVNLGCCPRHSPLTIAAQDSTLAQPWQPRAGASVPGHIRLRPRQQHPVSVICEPEPHQYCCQCQWVRQPPLVLCQRGTSSHDLPIQLC